MLQWPSPTVPRCRRGARRTLVSSNFYLPLPPSVSLVMLSWRGAVPRCGDLGVVTRCLALSARVSQVEGVRFEDDLQLS
jgi:hypothetical protein